MRISDWSSDVCSSVLYAPRASSDLQVDRRRTRRLCQDGRTSYVAGLAALPRRGRGTGDVMSGLNNRCRIAAIRRLPALPRTLFLLHNFYGVDVDAIADRLGTDRTRIAACLVDARRIVWAPIRFADDVPGMGPAPLELEARLQREYRQSLQAAFADSGSHGEGSCTAPVDDTGGAPETAAARRES